MGKRCSHCKVVKSRSEFPHDRSTKDGLNRLCTPCNKAKCIEYVRRTREERQAYRLRLAEETRNEPQHIAKRKAARQRYLDKHGAEKNARVRIRQAALTNEQRQKRAQQQRRRLLRFKYGISEAEYMQKFDEQGGLCAICKHPDRRLATTGVISTLSVDHDHNTGRVRDLLCKMCNSMLGLASDDRNVLVAGLEYLERWRIAFEKINEDKVTLQ